MSDLAERLGEVAAYAAKTDTWCEAAQTALYDARDELVAAEARVAALTQENKEARKALMWIRDFAAQMCAVQDRHTGFVHIGRRAGAALDTEGK